MAVNAGEGPFMGGMQKPQVDPAVAAKKASDAKIADLQKQIDQKTALLNTQAQKGPGYQALEQNQFEQQAGVTPPGYEGTRNAQTGELLNNFTINPFTGQASQKLQQEALGTGPSEWAKNALGQQAFEESNARGNAGLQNQQAQSSAMAQLMRQGGLGGGARTSLARSGARDALMANQGVANQGMLARYGINDTDTQRRQQLLGQTADVERAAQLQNQQTAEADINRKATFDANRYNQQMQAWGAKQSADATRAAGGGGGGGKK